MKKKLPKWPARRPTKHATLGLRRVVQHTLEAMVFKSKISILNAIPMPSIQKTITPINSNPVCYLIQPLSFRKIVRCNEDSAGHSFSYGQAV
ncbi:hypothetical protein SCG7109_AF_00170 [Chlamydiales bacterium SCGC AG-110-M15]|nr:hypothetical protein SCG7109_AF_00170 [Chlamydiales bacterium SCGC AG-110-M15]